MSMCVSVHVFNCIHVLYTDVFSTFLEEQVSIIKKKGEKKKRGRGGSKMMHKWKVVKYYWLAEPEWKEPECE